MSFFLVPSDEAAWPYEVGRIIYVPINEYCMIEILYGLS